MIQSGAANIPVLYSMYSVVYRTLHTASGDCTAVLKKEGNVQAVLVGIVWKDRGRGWQKYWLVCITIIVTNSTPYCPVYIAITGTVFH